MWPRSSRATASNDGLQSAAAIPEGWRWLRAALDIRNEKINYKVREHSHAKVPAMLVVGRREAEDGTVNIRRLGVKQQTSMPLGEAVKALAQEAVAPDVRRAMKRAA